MTLDPLSLWHHIELLPAERERRHSSGVILPDVWWSRQDSTALILDSGPGLVVDTGDVLPPMCQPGDLVLLDYGSFHQTEKARDGRGERGFVWEPQLIGWLACDSESSERDRIVPLNDWVLIRIDDRPTQAGSIVLSDQAERPRSGVVEAVGPGRLFTRGDYRGRRQAVQDICGCDLVGRRVHWGREADVVCAGRYKLTWVLIRAEQLTAAEEQNDACTLVGLHGPATHPDVAGLGAAIA